MQKNKVETTFYKADHCDEFSFKPESVLLGPKLKNREMEGL